MYFITKAGEGQAKRAAEKLRAEDFEVIYVSELLRTKQTAEFVNVYHGVSMVVDKRLNDISTGRENGSDSAYNAERAAADDPFTFRPDGGESLVDVVQRMKSFLEDLRKTKYQSVLVVSSGYPLLMLLDLIDGVDPRENVLANLKNGESVMREIA